MSRDLVILLILIGVGFVVGYNLAAQAPGADEEWATIVGALSSVSGIVIGYSYLAIEKWDKSKKPRARRAVYSPQVVGEICTKCSGRVIFVGEAFFCTDCSKPYHRRCGEAPRCAECAAKVSVANRAVLLDLGLLEPETVDLDYDFERNLWVENSRETR